MSFGRGVPVFVTLCAPAEWERGTNSCCFRELLSLLSYFLPVSRTSSWIPVPPTTLGMQDINQCFLGGEVLRASDFSGEGVTLFAKPDLLFQLFLSWSPLGHVGKSGWGILEAGHDSHGITPAQSYLQALGKVWCSCGWKVHELPRNGLFQEFPLEILAGEGSRTPG